MRQPLKTTSRLDFVDTIRGVAALVVLVHHYFLSYGTPLSRWPWIWYGPAGFIQDGSAAVGMFFLLSGFVLSRKYVAGGRLSRLNTRQWIGFSLARVCRIVIPFAITLWISALLQATVSQGAATSPSATAWVQSYWHARPWTELTQQSLLIRYGEDHLLPQDWTLVVEMYLSLALPLLILIATFGAPVLVLTVGVSIAVFHIHGAFLPFAAGIVVATYADRITDYVSKMRQRDWVAMLVLGVCVFHCREFLPDAALRMRAGIIWYLSEMGALLTFVALMGSPRSQGWLSRGPLVILGRVSYSFYLWHFTVLECLTPLMLGALNRLGIVAGAAWWVGLAATVIATLVVAAISFRLVERPCISAARWLNRIFATPARAETPLTEANRLPS